MENPIRLGMVVIVTFAVSLRLGEWLGPAETPAPDPIAAGSNPNRQLAPAVASAAASAAEFSAPGFSDPGPFLMTSLASVPQATTQQTNKRDQPPRVESADSDLRLMEELIGRERPQLSAEARQEMARQLAGVVPPEEIPLLLQSGLLPNSPEMPGLLMESLPGEERPRLVDKATDDVALSAPLLRIVDQLTLNVVGSGACGYRAERWEIYPAADEEGRPALHVRRLGFDWQTGELRAASTPLSVAILDRGPVFLGFSEISSVTEEPEPTCYSRCGVLQVLRSGCLGIRHGNRELPLVPLVVVPEDVPLGSILITEDGRVLRIAEDAENNVSANGDLSTQEELLGRIRLYYSRETTQLQSSDGICFRRKDGAQLPVVEQVRLRSGYLEAANQSYASALNELQQVRAIIQLFRERPHD